MEDKMEFSCLSQSASFSQVNISWRQTDKCILCRSITNQHSHLKHLLVTWMPICDFFPGPSFQHFPSPSHNDTIALKGGLYWCVFWYRCTHACVCGITSILNNATFINSCLKQPSVAIKFHIASIIEFLSQLTHIILKKKYSIASIL